MGKNINLSYINKTKIFAHDVTVATATKFGKEINLLKVILLATADNRKRYRFLIKPLKIKRHVPVLFKNSTVWFYPLRLILFALRHRDADLVILFGGGLKNAMGFLAARMIQAVVVIRLGGNPETALKSFIKGVIHQKKIATYFKLQIDSSFTHILLRKADAFFIVNNSLRKYVEQYAKHKARTWVVPQFSEPCEYSRVYSIESSRNLLTIANLNFQEKAEGVIWMIRKLRNFKEKYNIAMTFCIVGGGAFLEIVKKEAELLSDKEGALNIKIEGFKKDVVDYYRWAGIFIYNSQLDATPNVILEAKAHGLPVLINDFEPFRNLVSDGISGYFYANGNEFERKLHNLITIKDGLQIIGQGSKDDYLNRFTSKAVALKIDSALNDLEKMLKDNANCS